MPPSRTATNKATLDRWAQAGNDGGGRLMAPATVGVKPDDVTTAPWGGLRSRS
jgi:hypothetical protein